MGSVTTHGVGRYAPASPAEAHMAGWGRLYNSGGRGVLWLHGSGGTELEPWGGDPGVNDPTGKIARFLVTCGFVVMGIDANGKNWGNDAAQTLCDTAITYMQATYQVSGAVAMVGVSMGAALALNYQRNNPGKVSSLALFYPAADVQACHDATGGASNLSTEIETAYTNLAGWNAAAPTHDPARSPTSFAGVPIKMWYSTTDAIVGTANQTAFAAAVGGSAFASVSLGPVTHADMSQPDPVAVASFLA